MLRLRCLIALWSSLSCFIAQANAQQPVPDRSPQPEWLDTDRSTPTGSQYFEFQSSVLNAKASALVWQPPAYRRFPNARFPVIYFLHGANGNQRTVAETMIPFYIESMKKRMAPPAIIVGVNGVPRSFYLNSAAGEQPVEDVIIQDLIPSIDAHFRTLADRQHRMVMGFSMGGFGATRIGFKYLDLFGAIDIVSAGPLTPYEQLPPGLRRHVGEHREELPFPIVIRNVDKARADGTLIRITCGTDDSLYQGNSGLHNLLEKRSIPHRFIEVEGVGHSLPQILQKQGPKHFLFQRRAFEGNGTQ